MNMIFFKKPWVQSCLAGLIVFSGILWARKDFWMQRTVHVQICLAAPASSGVQVYYRTRLDEDYSDERYIPLQTVGIPAVAEVLVPAQQLWGLRFDFGSSPGEFTILGGVVGDIPLPPWQAWSFSSDLTLRSAVSEPGELKLFSDGNDPNMYVSFRRPIQSVQTLNRKRLLQLMSFALAVALAAGMFLLRALEKAWSAEGEPGGFDRPVVIGLSPYELVFLVCCAVYYFSWIFQPFAFSPDELMRFEVTRFLFDHGRLPVNEETINGVWGFSYAHTPTMFCNVFGALFMKICSVFSSDATTLLHAARILSVFCITGTVYWTIRISKLLFGAPFNWLMVCVVAFLPQFAYVGSYVNNDSAALFGVSMILFAWVSAIGRRWNYGLATILSIGIAICTMSYFNSYSWIMFSMLMFPLTYLVRNGRQGMIRMGLFISGVALVLGSYLFLRHLHLYGDLLGFSTTKSFAMKYADPNYVPGVKKSICERGYSLLQMLIGMKWLEVSAKSFVGFFGCMAAEVPFWFYKVYASVFGVGLIGGLWKGIGWIRGWRHVGVCKWALLVSLIGCMAITIGLSIYYSYTSDYQPQGRYCFPALLPLALLTAKGIERIVNGTVVRKINGIIVFALCLLLGYVSWSSYLFYRNLF